GGYPLAVALTLFPEGPRAGAAPEEAVDGAYLPSWRAHVDRFTPGERKPSTVDGLRALRVTGSGPKHVREEVRKPIVLKEAQAVALLRERNPGKSVITYQARMSGKAGDFIPEVVVDPGEYREADYELSLSALLVSSRRATLLLECRAPTSRRGECDDALGSFERGLRVVERPRRLDLWTASPLKPGS
ncbi:MAG: hypothetical protein HY553_03805, partial [Elusimicrobia bacterium]|nr:hypothetical protein [Elusimicrobiota bacterium]